MSVPIASLEYGNGCEADCRYREVEHMHGKARVMPPFDPGPEFWAKLEAARAEWRRLEEAGTPYWCIHRDRDVTHERAVQIPDGFDPIHRTHGVICGDCHGYIQEG